MKYLQKIYEFIWCVFAYNYWYQQNQYNEVYDEWCREQIKSGCAFTDVTEYTAKLSGVTIWIKNHPFASFSIYDRKLPKYRPSRYVMFLMHTKLKKHLIAREKAKIEQELSKLKSILNKEKTDA